MFRAFLLAVLLGVVAATPTQAASDCSVAPPAKVPILYSAGDTVDEVHGASPIPGTKIGFKYWRFGIFWMNVWTTGGEFVVYQESGSSINFESLGQTPEEAAKKTSLSVDTFKKPWTYSFPPGLLILGGLVTAVVLKKLFSRG